MEENGRWVTMNGTHVFVKDGQSPMDAFIRQKANKQTEKEPEGFENSKIRDENGNLLKLYHGSTKDFEKFDKSKIGTGATMYASSGSGFYFTDSEASAEKYSKNGYKYSCYLNINKPFIVENKISNEADKILADFSKKIIKEHPEINEKTFGTYEIFNKNDIGQRSGTAILSNVVTEYGEEFTDYLKSKGYDGIKSSVTDYNNTGEQYNYVVFEPKQIKILNKRS